MRRYANSTHSVFEEDDFYEVWTNDESTFIEGYTDYQTAVTTANRLEEESACHM